MDILEAICAINPVGVRQLLDAGQPVDILDECGRSLLHIAVELPTTSNVLNHKIRHSSAKSDIIYMLIDAEVDLEHEDNDGKTCLLYAIENCDLETCAILLQTGADMYCMNSDGDSILDRVFSDTITYKEDVDEDLIDHLQDIFEIFYPGLWRAVESRDICQVRRLTNLWCKTNLTKDDKTLKELALDSGHEEIISLIYGIHDTMKLIHHLYAQNTKAVTTMLMASRKSLQLDLRKMSERGAPILYYLIQWSDAEMIQSFVKHGCHVYTMMRDEFSCDMPVLFSALEKNVPADVVKALLPKHKFQQEEMLYKLLYKGRTILDVALEKNANLDVFDVLVDRGGPLLIMDRNQFNQSVRDIAIESDKCEYADIIDKNVSVWITEPENYPGRRQALALYGYDHIKIIGQNEMEHLPGHQTNEFMNHLQDYQHQIAELVDVTEDGDYEKFLSLREFSDERNLFESNLSWDGRFLADGLPLLHRAVLFNHANLVKVILDKKPACQSVDTLFDQHHRTALHYASACSSYNEVRKLLLDSGCSEHVLDRRNKEPLDFRDQQDTTLMLELIERLKFKEYHVPEPDPWKDKMRRESLSNNNRQPKASYVYSPSENIWTYKSEPLERGSEDSDYNANDLTEEDSDSEPEGSSYSYCSIF